MLNFGLTDLRLVAPARRLAQSGGRAGGVGRRCRARAGARCSTTVAEAVADCAHVYATTVRKRGLVMPVVTPEEAAREIHAGAGRSAILFGAERSGLETEEVALAGKIVTVPVNPGFPLAQPRPGGDPGRLRMVEAAALAVPTEGDPAEPRASQAQLEGLIGQLDEALDAAGYFHPPDRTPATRNTMRTILTKAGWSNREIQALRGMIRALVNPRPRSGG